MYRKPDQHHFLQALPVQREPCHAAAAFLPEHEDQDCGGGYVLRGGRGDADAQRAQLEACDHQDIQPDVGNAGNCQEEQRVLRVAARSLNGGKVIVQQAARHSGEVRLHVRNGAWQDFLCCTHQPEQWLGCEEAEHADRHAPDERHGQGGICQFVHRLVAFCPDVLRGYDACPDRQSHEQVHDKIDQCAAAAHGAHFDLGIRAAELPHDRKVGCIEQQLQHARCQYRQGEQDHPPQNGTFRHIDLLFCHD